MCRLPGQGSGGPENFIYIGQIEPKTSYTLQVSGKTPYTLVQA